MTKAELIIEQIKNYLDSGLWVRMGCILSRDDFKVIIKALEQQDKIIQILDDCDLEAWEILEKIKEVVTE
jgi:hypothetical protein